MSHRKITAACAATLALVLSACGSSSDGESSKSPTTSSQKGGSASSVPKGDSQAPSLNTSGQTPLITFPKTKAPDKLSVTVLEEGTGATITKKDYIVADYVGQVWGKSKPFDSSYSRGLPMGTDLSAVVKGWGDAIAGHKVGVKLLVSIPPDLGYGEKGQPRVGIGKDDVMTFYITVHQTSNKETAGQADARTEMDLATLPVTIQGAIGSPVTGLKVKDASASISEKSVSVIARGTGPAVGKTGTMTVAYAAISPDGQNFQTTWGERNQGPQLAAIGNKTVFDSLVGLPVGSRVFMTVPAVEGQGDQGSSPAMYAVVDILGYIPQSAEVTKPRGTK